MDRAGWVRSACAELIPEAARRGLVDAVDIYVEDIAFSLEDLDAVAGATAARRSARCACMPTSSVTPARRPRPPGWARAAPTT